MPQIGDLVVETTLTPIHGSVSSIDPAIVRIDHLPMNNIKRRRKLANIPCTLTVADMMIPATCSVLGIPIFIGTGAPCGNSREIIVSNLGMGTRGYPHAVGSAREESDPLLPG